MNVWIGIAITSIFIILYQFLMFGIIHYYTTKPIDWWHDTQLLWLLTLPLLVADLLVIWTWRIGQACGISPWITGLLWTSVGLVGSSACIYTYFRVVPNLGTVIGIILVIAGVLVSILTRN
jgi:hypothetical protein